MRRWNFVVSVLPVLALAGSCGGLSTGKVPPCVYSNTWATVDDFTIGLNAIGQRTAVDTLGNVYVAIDATPSTNVNQWMIRKSSNAGTSWSTVETLSSASTGSVGARGFFADTSGNVYASGWIRDSANHEVCIMLKGSNGGTTWNTIDSYQFVPGTKDSGCQNGGIDTSGNLYQTVSDQDGASARNWTTRRSTNGGTSWTALDSVYSYSYPLVSTPNSIFFDSKGNLFVAGLGNSVTTTEAHWLIRRSTDNGATWTNVDDTLYTAGQLGGALFLTSVPGTTNTLFAIGQGNDASGITHWLSHRSTDGGATWSAFQDYLYASGQSSTPQALILDRNNKLVVGGWGADSTGVRHWLTRISADGGTTWTNSDDFVYSPGQISRLTHLSMDPSGNLYASGAGVDPSGINHSLVRKLACVATTVPY